MFYVLKNSITFLITFCGSTCENMCEGMADVVVQICRLEPTDMRRQCFFGYYSVTYALSNK